MADPMKPDFTAQNPIVDAANRIRAQREVARALDERGDAPSRLPEDAHESLTLFAEHLQMGAKRLNAIFGGSAMKIVKLERPLRLRVRFGAKRVSLDLDDVHQLVRVAGEGLEGEYQFDLSRPVPSLINLSKLSTEAGYGEPLTPSSLLRLVAADAELPRPAHLDRSGPLQL